MKKTKDLFIEQRIWEDRLELLPHEEEFIYNRYVQNDKRRVGDVLGTNPLGNRQDKRKSIN
jgi:hypothetical protein